MRFAPLMATIASVSFTNSSSLKYDRTSANTSSGNIGLGKRRQGFGPGKCRALPLGVEGAFAPCAEKIRPLLSFPGGTQLLGVHVHASGATVDLRCL
jgi:hypothetical protein